ncbi:DUF6458 family protein [Microbacterium fluvii]|uniref:DUF6458 family protein n=1 Tax=Microbacterium fluvii TaxID=415215 RepID=A0ABW2HAY9_9MICO|nr:DUF6458 family protein [Microbacterium fluvii]MCU4672072.1 DUF6458 family protein [Microbacterium fluvii]
MSIGAGVALFVIGAILVWGVNVEVEWVNLDMIGYILMGAGVLVFLLGLVLMMRHRQTETVTHTSVDPAAGQSTTRRSTSISGDEVV